MKYKQIQYLSTSTIITGPPNGPVLFFSLSSVVVVCRCLLSVIVCNTAGGQAGRRARCRSGGRHSTTGQYCYIPLGRHLVKSKSLHMFELKRNLTNHCANKLQIKLPYYASLYSISFQLANLQLELELEFDVN